jgi:hypothetical protein
MSYILCLAFRSMAYKTPPLIRCFVNDLFIDEFYIDRLSNPPNTIEVKKDIWSVTTKKIMSSEEWKLSGGNIKLNLLPDNFFDLYDNDIFLRFFEIDEKIFKEDNKNLIRIEFDCNSNNYTNGFLTKQSMIQLASVYCCPKNILQNYNVFLEDFKIKNKNIRQYSNLNELFDWYKWKKTFFDIVSFSTDDEHKKLVSWHNNLSKKTFKISPFQWVGGLGTLTVSFDKDLLDFTENKLLNYAVDYIELYTLANKYKEYENYGNNH